jgi:hypothetical protein
MSVHVEWEAANETSVCIIDAATANQEMEDGELYLGDDVREGNHVLILSANEVHVIEGGLAQIDRLLSRILRERAKAGAFRVMPDTFVIVPA